MFKQAEPVTICDQFSHFLFGKLEAETFGETFLVSFYSLIEYFGLNIIQHGQIPVKQYLLPSYR